ncbi:hypothetical protein R1flu_006491 [Riccia fluitans]|uniref:RNase H type-1 domain-containing protein n=1 Tax=Riccia fluitans TaxID=41844 RepID=A0ABD1YW54_9MARC
MTRPPCPKYPSDRMNYYEIRRPGCAQTIRLPKELLDTFDSSRSGYHGTLLVINVDDDRVIEMVTLTRKEVGSSWKIETMALEQALTTLKQKGLTIEEVVHDDNASVDAILTQHGILSSKDLWHKCKNIMSKFKEVLQEKRKRL